MTESITNESVCPKCGRDDDSLSRCLDPFGQQTSFCEIRQLRREVARLTAALATAESALREKHPGNPLDCEAENLRASKERGAT